MARKDLSRGKLGAAESLGFDQLRLLPHSALAAVIESAARSGKSRMAWALWSDGYMQPSALWEEDSSWTFQGHHSEQPRKSLPEIALETGNRALARACLSRIAKSGRPGSLSAWIDSDFKMRRAARRLFSALEKGPLAGEERWMRRCLEALGPRGKTLTKTASEASWLAGVALGMGHVGLAREIAAKIPSRLGKGGAALEPPPEAWRFGDSGFDKCGYEDEALFRAFGSRSGKGGRVPLLGKAYAREPGKGRDGLVGALLDQGHAPTPEMVARAVSGEEERFAERILEGAARSIRLRWDVWGSGTRAGARLGILRAIRMDDPERAKAAAERAARALALEPAEWDPCGMRISQGSMATAAHAALAMGSMRCARAWLEKAPRRAWPAAEIVLEVDAGGKDPRIVRAERGEWGLFGYEETLALERRHPEMRETRKGEPEARMAASAVSESESSGAAAARGLYDLGALGLLAGDEGIARLALSKTRDPGKSLERALSVFAEGSVEGLKAKWEGWALAETVSRSARGKKAPEESKPPRRARKA